MRPKRAHPDKVAGRALTSLTSGLLAPVCRLRYMGTQNLPKSGGFIAVSNHASELDGITFTEYLFDNGYKPHVFAKQVLFRVPVVGLMFRDSGMIPVSRGSDKAANSLDIAEKLLREGKCVGIFPEGTLTRDPDLWPMEGKTGVARLALATRVPVIPIGQWGATNILGRYSRVLKAFPRKTVTLKAGPPVDLSEFYDKPITAELLRAATSKIMDAVTNIVGELRGETPPVRRFDLHLHPEYKKKQQTYPPLVRP